VGFALVVSLGLSHSKNALPSFSNGSTRGAQGTWNGWRANRNGVSIYAASIPACAQSKASRIRILSQSHRTSTGPPSCAAVSLLARSAHLSRHGARAEGPRSRLRSPRHGRTPSTRIYVDTAGVGTPRRTSKKSQGKLLTITKSHGHKGYMHYGVLHRERSNTRWALFWPRIWHLFGPDLIG